MAPKNNSGLNVGNMMTEAPLDNAPSKTTTWPKIWKNGKTPTNLEDGFVFRKYSVL